MKKKIKIHQIVLFIFFTFIIGISLHGCAVHQTYIDESSDTNNTIAEIIAEIIDESIDENITVINDENIAEVITDVIAGNTENNTENVMENTETIAEDTTDTENANDITESITESIETAPTSNETELHICKFIEQQLVLSPTCTQTGKAIEVCACGAVNEILLPPLGHNEITIEGVKPTCLKGGLTDGRKCTVCGAITASQMPVYATGHNTSIINKKEPTCNSGGYTGDNYCHNCKQIVHYGEWTEKLPHSEINIDSREPSCTETGLTNGKKCRDCGIIIKEQETVPATGHIYVLHIIKAPTCITTGIKTYSCQNCNDNYEEVMRAIDHSPIVLQRIEATCTSDGLTEGSVCSVCNVVLSPQKTIPATGHKEITLSGKPPTCTTEGLTQGKKCDVCGIITVSQTVIAPSEHTYQSGICIVCHIDPVVMLPKMPEDIAKSLVKPTKAIFGDDWEKAMTLYNAILNKEDLCAIVFDSEKTSFQNSELGRQFTEKFEEYVLQDLPLIQYQYSTGYHTEYIYDTDQMYAEYYRLNEYTDILLSLGINNGMDKKEACLLINDYICDNVEYKTGARTLYEAFELHTANCEGYSRLYTAMCNRASIETGYISGRVKSTDSYGNHAWNTVCIAGETYYTDVCWNDLPGKYKNQYFMSPVLWNNHTSELDINVSLSSNLSNKTIHFPATPTNINDIITKPTKEIYGTYYDMAMQIYNAIINGEEMVQVILDCTNTSFYPAVMSDTLIALFERETLNNNAELFMLRGQWQYDGPKIGLITFQISSTTKTLKEYIELADCIRQFNLEARVYDGQNEAEAVACIINYMCNQLEFDYWLFNDTVPQAIKERKSNQKYYSQIFAVLCHDAGIECEIIEGTACTESDPKHRWVSYNRVQIGDKWYYTNMWYYFNISYKDYEKNAYLLSEEVWSNHTLNSEYQN